MNNSKDKFFFYGAGSKAVTCDMNIEATLSLSKGVVANNLEILGYCDENKLNSERAVTIYGGEVFDTIFDIKKNHGNIHLIISTPDHLHYKHIMEALKLNPLGIMAEKPLALNSNEAREIMRLVKENNLSFTVNYFRRFLPSFRLLKEEIGEGLFGEFLFARGLYDKGLFHNGSHLINLLLFFFESLSVTSVSNKIESTIKGDENYSFELCAPKYNDGKIYIQNGNERYYTLFELEMFFENKMIKIADFGRRIEYYEPKEDSIPSYHSLKESKSISTDYMKSAYYTIKAYKESIDTNGLEDAVRVVELCEEIVKQYEDSSMCI